MKKIQLTIILLCAAFAVNAQFEDDGFGDASKSSNSIDTEEEPAQSDSSSNMNLESTYFASISADALNVVYVGLNNPISVAVGGIDPENIIVELEGSNSGIELIGSNGRYSIKCSSSAARHKEITIKVTAKLAEGVINIGSKKFRIKRVPRPRFVLGPVVSWNAPIEAGILRNVPVVTAYLDGFTYEGVKFKIVSYEFQISRDGETKRARVYGNSTEQIKKYLEDSRRGDIISFYNIQAKGPSGSIVFLDDVMTTVK